MKKFSEDKILLSNRTGVLVVRLFELESPTAVQCSANGLKIYGYDENPKAIYMVEEFLC